jgi:putative DNA primase/helicase
MTEAVRVRDWLAELRTAAEAGNSDLFRSLVVTIADAQPDLKTQVCQLAGEFLEDGETNGETWAADFFKKPVEEPKPEKVKPLTVLPAQNEERPAASTMKAAEVADVDSAEGWEREKRRSWGGEEEERPSVSSEELVTKVLEKKKAEGSLFLNTVQPEVENVEVTPEAAPEPIPAGKALVPVARFGNETPRTPDTVPATLAQSSPYDTAKEYVRRQCFREGALATYFWQNEFWEWNGRHYATIEPQIIRDRVYAFLDGSRKFVGGDELTRFRPTPKLVNDVLDALKAGLVLAAKYQAPMWIDTEACATDVLVFRNGLVNVRTGETMELTPRLWVHSAVDYGYEPQAKCPVWEWFLEKVFPGDKASQDFIEEWLGYGMTMETKFEKAAMFIGKSRSGKGTIAFVQRELIGDGAYVGLSLTNWLSNENSASGMIGKRVGVFPDVRVKPGKHYGASYDAGGITYPSIEMLLKITGRDHVSIGRKYSVKFWEGQLRLKLTLISNDPLNFNDARLVSRFIKINFPVNFYGREDPDLREKLRAEISGIANRCMAAYRRLVGRGKFLQPQSGIALEQKVLAETDPYTAFVNDLFVIDPLGMVNCGLVKIKFDDWCRERGRLDLRASTPTGSLLTQRLKSVAGLEQLRTMKPHGQQRQYVGLRLKSKEERESE